MENTLCNECTGVTVENGVCRNCGAITITPEETVVIPEEVVVTPANASSSSNQEIINEVTNE